jgi:hypothetical protein
MARGWESKSVEAQQADRDAAAKPTPTVTAEEAANRGRRAALELARSRALADLRVAVHPPHRRMLETAIAALDAQLRDWSHS